MELKDIQQLLDDGYSLVLPKKKKIEDCVNYKKVDIKIADIKEIVLNNSDKYNEKFEVDDNTALLIKTFARYDLSINDVIKKFELEISKKEKFNFDSLLKWSFDLSNGFFNPAITNEFLSDYSDVYDYLFESNEHFLKYSIRKLRFIKEENAFEETQNLLEIINDIWSNRLVSKKERKYKDKTISSLIYEQSVALDIENFAYSYEFNEFYRDNVLRLAELGDGSSMRLLGYNYYEGTFGFEVDPSKSLFWLEKAYEKTKDPDIARTIGYIYFYGRTTNGLPQGDKAFQYFAIGHLAGGYYEATYKLADCYLMGYGTPISEQAAFNLVSSIYNETKNKYLDGDDNKFADVALRMGSFYKNGIYVKIDLNKALIYYLEARDAIKTRVSHMNYIGDTGVAVSISKAIEEIKQELNIKDRTIVEGGYFLKTLDESIRNCSIKLKYIDNKHLSMTVKLKKGDRDSCFGGLFSIPYIERVKEEHYLILVDGLDKETFDEAFDYQWDSLDGYGEEIYFSNSKTWVMQRIGGIIYIPQNLKVLEKSICIAAVEFYPGSKQYDYLCPFDAKIGEIAYIKSHGEQKEVRILSLKNVYEDETSLPINKMGKLNKGK